ncbi:hypothetical protein EMCRGX_G013540 [Ephydatia muelleri]
MSTEEFLKGVEQEESASRQRQFESHEATASALAEQELATTQHESSAAQREPPATEHEPLAAHDQHLADEAIVSNRAVSQEEDDSCSSNTSFNESSTSDSDETDEIGDDGVSV